MWLFRKMFKTCNNFLFIDTIEHNIVWYDIDTINPIESIEIMNETPCWRLPSREAFLGDGSSNNKVKYGQTWASFIDKLRLYCKQDLFFTWQTRVFWCHFSAEIDIQYQETRYLVIGLTLSAGLYLLYSSTSSPRTNSVSHGKLQVVWLFLTCLNCCV